MKLLPSLEDSRSNQSNNKLDKFGNKRFSGIEKTATGSVIESSSEGSSSLDLLRLQEQEQPTPTNATRTLDFLFSPISDLETSKSEKSQSSDYAEGWDPSCLTLLPNICQGNH